MTVTAALNRTTPGCPTDLLNFDLNNPRLEDGGSGTAAGKDDINLIKSLRSVAALGELVQSICSNGYKDIEPLIVSGPDGGPFTVLEGNRRLASIRLIKNADLANEVGIPVPADLAPEIRESIETVSVYRVASAEVARAYIGFKHINGPHRWESFAKAKFVTDWYKAGRASGLAIDDIADQLGDDNRTIKNMIGGMLVLEQAIEGGFSIANRSNKGRFAFSHLYTGLARKEYAEFLGLLPGWSEAPAPNPVPAAKAEALQEVMLWLFGAKDRSRDSLITSQNPDLAILGQVLHHKVALSIIRAGKPLEEAKKELRPVQSVLSDVLIDVNHKLREAVTLASRADAVDDSVQEIGRQILKQAQAVVLLLNQSSIPPAPPPPAKPEGP